MAPGDNRRRVAARLTVLQVCTIAVFAALAFSFWFIQVVQGEHFRELAENNNQRTLALRAPRGVVYDRNLKVLVENRHSFTISLDREHTQDVERTIRGLAAVARVDADTLREIVARRILEPRYRAIVLIEDASLEQVAAITERQFEQPGVIIEEVPARQ
jgi:penicillin-binding protein 2